MKKATTLALSLFLGSSALAGGAEYAAPKSPLAPAPQVQVFEPLVVPVRPASETQVSAQPTAPAQATIALDKISGARLLDVALKANDAEGLQSSYYKAAVYVLGENGEFQDMGLTSEVYFDLAAPQTMTKTLQSGQLVDVSLLTPDGAYNATPQGGVIPLPRAAANELWRAAIASQEGLAYAKAYPERVAVENGGQTTWLQGEGAVTGQVLRLKFSDELGGGSNEMLLNSKGVVIAEAFTLKDVGLVYAMYGDEGVADVDVATLVLPEGIPFMAVKKLETKINPTFAPDTFEVPSE